MNKYSECLFVSDIDGTLLNKSRKIPDINVSAVRSFVSKGGNFTLCSGRNLQSLSKHYKTLEIETPAIFLNGAGIFDFKSNELISLVSFSQEALRKLEATAKRFKSAELTLYSPTKLYIVQSRLFGATVSKLDGLDHCYEKTVNSEEIGKATFFALPSTLEKIRNSLQNDEKNEFNCFRTSVFTLEVAPNGVNKGAAVKKLAKHLGIEAQNVSAVGDYYNDVDMLKAVSHPVACGQAPDDVKALAEYVACHCNDGAVSDFIDYIEKKYIL